MKLNLHVFRNKRQQVFLPRGKDTHELAQITIDIIRKLSPPDAPSLKYVRHRDETLIVDSQHHNGFFLNGFQYIYGETYRRISQ